MFNKLQKSKPNEFVLMGLMVSSLALIGCASRGGILGVDCCADVPAGAIPEPAGAKVYNWQEAQVTGAVADQTVLYQADFVGATAKLAPGAIDRMARNANGGLAGLQSTFIEPSGDASLDAERVSAANMQLASLGVTAPVVEVATPAAFGLRGPQAETVARAAGSNRNSNVGTGTTATRTFGQSGQSGNLPGGIF